MTDGLPLYLMRHGEPVLAGRMLGWTDCAATPAGIAACVERARTLQFDRVVSSDLVRSVAAAQAIAAPRGLDPVIDPRWRELNFGVWDGLAASDIEPSALERFWTDPDAYPPPGGERWSFLVGRARAALDALDGPTLIVTHGGAMRAALAMLCGFRQRELWAFDLPYAALITLRVWRGSPATAQIVGLQT